MGNQPNVVPVGATGGPPPTQLANVPSGQQPATTLANVPGQPGQAATVPVAGQPGQSGAPPATTLHNVPDQPVYDTNHHKQMNTPSGSGGGGLLSKLKPSKSQEKISTSATPPPSGGPPIVHTTTPPAGAGGKQTRFSDTAHALPPSEESTVIHNVPQDDTGSPQGVTVVDTPGHNKLKKGKPVVHQEGHSAVPGIGPGHVVATPGHGGPGGTPPPTVVQSTPAPAGTTVPATTKVTAGTPPAGAKIAPTPSGAPAPGANVAVPKRLEEVILPDGRIAYVRPSPASGAGLSKKGKVTEDLNTSNKTKVTGGGPAEADMNRAHCSVCCPTAPRTTHGVPIDSCAHQDGPLGPAAPAGPGSTKSKTKVTQPGVPGGRPSPPGAGLLNLPGDTAIPVEEERMAAPDGSNKLKKKPTAGPPALSLSNEEKAMEDARVLASESLIY